MQSIAPPRKICWMRGNTALPMHQAHTHECSKGLMNTRTQSGLRNEMDAKLKDSAEHRIRSFHVCKRVPLQSLNSCEARNRCLLGVVAYARAFRSYVNAGKNHKSHYIKDRAFSLGIQLYTDTGSATGSLDISTEILKQIAIFVFFAVLPFAGLVCLLARPISSACLCVIETKLVPTMAPFYCAMQCMRSRNTIK